MLALLVALLVGMAVAGPVAAYATTLENDSGFAMIFRFGVVPAFLFSGAFFPVSQLPNWIEWLAYVSPLWHGVHLSRGLAEGSVNPWLALLNVVYLLAWFIIGTKLAVRGFRKRLIG